MASADDPAFGVDSDLPVPFEVACQCQKPIWIQAKRGEFGFCRFRGIHMPRQRPAGLQLGHRANGGDSDQHERRGGYNAAASLGPQAKALFKLKSRFKWGPRLTWTLLRLEPLDSESP